MGSHKFKLGMFLTEPQLPFEEALDLAAELGVKYLWYMCNGQVSGRPEDKALVEMSEAEIDAMQAKVQRSIRLRMRSLDGHIVDRHGDRAKQVEGRITRSKG